MKYLKRFESPDYIRIKHPITNKNLDISYDDSDAVVFCYYGEEMLIGFGITHRDMLDELNLDYEEDEQGIIRRTDMGYPGRMWMTRKIMSFWIYPTPEELPKILQDIEKIYNDEVKKLDEISYPKEFVNKYYPKLDFNDPEWLIEVFDENLKDPDDYDWRGTQKLVPLSNYTGSKQRDEEELKIPHLMNWKEKQELKKKGWGRGFGSDKTAWDSKNPLAWRQAKYQENKNNIYDMKTKFNDFLNESIYNDSLMEKLYEKLEIAEMAIEKWGNGYEKQKERIQNIIDGKEKLDFKNPLLIQGDTAKENYDIFNSSNALMIASELNKIVKKYKKYEVSDSSIPSGPDSTKFKATVGGDIRIVCNYTYSGGYYAGNRNILIGIQVGSGIDKDIYDKIMQESYEVLFLMDQYNSSDGGVMTHYSHGTNWGMIGLACSKYSFSDNMKAKINKEI